MGKNVRLADIYIKIYNKKPLTMDDLAFLAKYDRECFEKTCHNLIFNEPETKKLMQPEHKSEVHNPEAPVEQGAKEQTTKPTKTEAVKEETVKASVESGEDKVNLLLKNLKKLEQNEIGIQKLEADHVKNLLGSLYMEMLFPHNDRDRYFHMESEDEQSTFNKKA